ncbi:MAG TPA: TonB-dependent receptor, partial [Pseudomonadales bacterium]|nr:TonB-dependent receptor [Pseudomonadales bacterium]
FASTDWADFMAHVEVFWQEKTYAAALWTGSYEIGSRTGNIAPVIYDQVVLKDRVLVNLRLGMENVEFSNGTSLRASLWARNVFDREYNSYGMNFGALGPVLAQYGEPRTYGLDVTWEF